MNIGNRPCVPIRQRSSIDGKICEIGVGQGASPRQWLGPVKRGAGIAAERKRGPEFSSGIGPRRRSRAAGRSLVRLISGRIPKYVWGPCSASTAATLAGMRPCNRPIACRSPSLRVSPRSDPQRGPSSALRHARRGLVTQPGADSRRIFSRESAEQDTRFMK